MQRGSLPRPAVGVVYTRHYLILTVIKACIHYGNCTAYQVFFNEALLYEVFFVKCVYVSRRSVSHSAPGNGPTNARAILAAFRIGGDGNNCLYRALSLVLFEIEDYISCAIYG